MLMQTAMERFIKAREAGGYSPRTLDGYRYALRPLAAAHRKVPRKPEQIEDFLARWMDPETRRTRYWRLHAFYAWMVERKHLKAKHNPMTAVPEPRVQKKHARGLTDDELAQLYGYPHRRHMWLFLLLLIDCGVRKEEGWGLQKGDVKDSTIIVTGKSGQREVPVSPEIRNMLLDLLPFPWKSPESAGQLVRRAFRKAGISGRRASAQTLRVTWTRRAKMDKVTKKAAGGWKTYKMLEHYLGDITDDVIEQHRSGTPLRLVADLVTNAASRQ
ncbi:MAG: hypothetical protein WD533_06395 [Dehalococcoidia bacterium]